MSTKRKTLPQTNHKHSSSGNNQNKPTVSPQKSSSGNNQNIKINIIENDISQPSNNSASCNDDKRTLLKSYLLKVKNQPYYGVSSPMHRAQSPLSLRIDMDDALNPMFTFKKF
eukprot:422710_1